MDFSENNSDLIALPGTSADDVLQGTTDNDRISGGGGNDFLTGLAGNDFIAGGVGNDSLTGGTLAEDFATIGGKDTLEGGEGDDSYGVSLGFGGGTTITDTAGNEILIILAENTNTVGLGDGSFDPSDPTAYGDAAITLSLPQSGIVGLERSQTDLIIDLNRDGVAERENDLTIVNFFEGQQLGSGAMELINNIVNPQTIVDFFNSTQDTSNEDPVADNTGATIYRFFDNTEKIHFYTADTTEKETVEQLDDFVFEGASYSGVDPSTEGSIPVYRFLNEDTGVHLYTVSEVEREATANLDNYSFEGEVFSAYATEVDNSIPIYRFLNTTTGAHFYTPSTMEKDIVEDNLSDFQFEGIAYYALPNPTKDLV